MSTPASLSLRFAHAAKATTSMAPRFSRPAFSVGTDICHIPRIRAIVLKRYPASLFHFGRRLFNETEYVVFLKKCEELEAISRTRRRSRTAGLTNFLRWTRRMRALCSSKLGQRETAADESTIRPDDRVDLDLDSVSLQRLAEWLAGNFAAKEAVQKAIDGHATLHSVSIFRDANGAPFGVYHREGKEEEKEANGGTAAQKVALHVPLSISHDGEYATAVAIVSRAE